MGSKKPTLVSRRSSHSSLTSSSSSIPATSCPLLADQRHSDPATPAANRPLWANATYASITGFAKNPVYAGRYIIGKTRQEPPAEGSRKRGRQQRQSADRWVVIDEHHTPYVDPGQWADVQNRICANRINIRPALGRGEALGSRPPAVSDS